MGIIDTGKTIIQKLFSGADDVLGSAFAKNSVEAYSNMTTPEWKHAVKTTPVFLPGESQGRRSLVGCHLWGHKLDTTEAT